MSSVKIGQSDSGIVVTKNLVRGFTAAALAVTLFVGNTLHTAIISPSEREALVSDRPTSSATRKRRAGGSSLYRRLKT